MSANTIMATVRVGQGRTKPLTWTLDYKGAPANLTTLDIAGLTISIVRTTQWLSASEFVNWDGILIALGTPTLKVDHAAVTIVTAASGDVSWAPGPTDLDTPANYYYQFEATDGSGYTWPWPEDVRHSRMIVFPSIV